MKFLHLIALVILFLGACTPKKSICDYGTIEDQVKCLNSLPTESIPSFQKELPNHDVYYSITTSPQRIPNLKYVLKTLDLSIPNAVFIVLPQKYRNKEPYNPKDIEEIQNYSDKIVILRPDKDLGPIMKLVPAVEQVRYYTQKIGTKLVVTLDDDIGIPSGLPEQIIHTAWRHPGTAIGGSGQDAGFWSIHGFPHSQHHCKDGELSECDVLEGYHIVAYPVNRVNTEEIKRLSAMSKFCKFSDDLVISYVLATSGIKRYLIRNKFTENLLPFEFGLGEDALHKEGNEKKYQECFRLIHKNSHLLPN